ncbi:hypothetical protein [Roseibium sp. Sym1]|uniref:hypothetical protein n=1 Tax=Roseibium sp. Sym1 TaxID=3016006 RepID=UPI0022B391D9|nr:hypothetical protein [Roseibium sp. Sym1]
MAKSSKNSKPGKGHNSEVTLSEEDIETLTRQHKQGYEKVLSAKKAAEAVFKNYCKQIKTDLGPKGLADIKVLIDLETPEGEQKFKDEMDRLMRCARWAGMPLNMQGTLFDEDRVPADERAFQEGKIAGQEGKTLKPPFDPGTAEYEKYTEGWHAGQASITKIKKLKAANDPNDTKVIKQQEKADQKSSEKDDISDSDETSGDEIPDFLKRVEK